MQRHEHDGARGPLAARGDSRIWRWLRDEEIQHSSAKAGRHEAMGVDITSKAMSPMTASRRVINRPPVRRAFINKSLGVGRADYRVRTDA